MANDEEKSFDRINMTEWLWPKNLYMTERITPTNMNDGTWPKKYKTKNMNGWIWLNQLPIFGHIDSVKITSLQMTKIKLWCIVILNVM